MFALFDMTTRGKQMSRLPLILILHSPEAWCCGSCPGLRIESLTMSWRRTRMTQTRLIELRRSTEDWRWISLICLTPDWSWRPLVMRTYDDILEFSIDDRDLILLSSLKLTLPGSILTRRREGIFCQRKKLRPCYCYSWPAVSWYCKQHSTEATGDC